MDSKLQSGRVKLMRVLLLNLSSSSILKALHALKGQGYQVFEARDPTLDEIISFHLDVLIVEVTPADRSCCPMISRIKSLSHLGIPKIVLVVYGSALERTRALALGADDVLSAPVEPAEFAARVRSQSEAYPDSQLAQGLKGERRVKNGRAASTGSAYGTNRHGPARAFLVFAKALMTISSAILKWRNCFPIGPNQKLRDPLAEGLTPQGLSRNIGHARVPETLTRR